MSFGRRWQLPPTSRLAHSPVPQFQDRKVCTLLSSRIFFFPSLPTSLPVCAINLCSTLHSSLVRYHFLITCVSFFSLFYPIPLCFFPLHLVHLEGGLSPPPLPPPMGKTSICFRGRNRGKQLVDRNIPPSFLPPSLLCLFTGICAVWMRVNEGHLVADWEPNTLLLLLLFLGSSNRDPALLSPAPAVCTAVWTDGINGHLQQTDTVGRTRVCERARAACASVGGFWM